MSQVSLSNQININKVDVGYAARIQSDRIQNPDNMTCPLWSGQDISGRKVCAGSFLTKMEGCNSAEDRVFVENSLRPRYSNYVTLSAAGIAGGPGVDGDYKHEVRNNLLARGATIADASRRISLGQSPRFGTINSDSIRGISSGRGDVAAANAFAGQDADAAASQNSRIRQNTVIGKQSQKRLDAQYNNVTIPNENGDYQSRNVNSQGYTTLKRYP